MKIGIVTITELDNPGNRLQNYALQEVLRSYGASVETIPNLIKYKYRKSIRYQAKMFLKGLLQYKRNKDKSYLSEIYKQFRFSRFDKKYFKFSKYFSTYDYISPDLKDAYDYFVAGSDQIWNPYFVFNLDFNFLAFADYEKRISYAASFGVDQIPRKQEKKFKNYLMQMKSLSVREDAGKQIIRSLTQRESEVLLDPTLLLSRKEWMEIQKKPRWIKKRKDFILTYFLGSAKSRKELVRKIRTQDASFMEVPVIDIQDKQDVSKYCSTPDEFIWLIAHAKLMVTDSFHGMVFCILMKTPFVAAPREDGNISMNSRIETLANRFGLNSKNLIVRDHIIEADKMEQILTFERKRSGMYLQKSLGL